MTHYEQALDRILSVEPSERYAAVCREREALDVTATVVGMWDDTRGRFLHFVEVRDTGPTGLLRRRQRWFYSDDSKRRAERLATRYRRLVLA